MIIDITLFCLILALTYSFVRFKARAHQDLNVLFDSAFNLGDKLKKIKDDLEDPYIGEVYHRNWKKFRQTDISDHFDRKYKIDGIWHKYSKIIFYESIYEETKLEIEE